jgi:hypothetical protein
MVGKTSVLPDDTVDGVVLPDNTGVVLPDNTGVVLPDDTGVVFPDDTVAPAPVVAATEPTGPFRISFSPNEFSDLWETFKEAANDPQSPFETPGQGFASSLIDTLVFDPYYEGKMDYNSLRLGTAPILKELGIDGGLSDGQIIELFSEDEEGNDIIADPELFEGLNRRSLGAAGGTAGFFTGLRLGNALVSGVPPLTPWTAAVRLGVPLITGAAGYMGLSMLGDAATEKLMGREPIMVPGRESADYKAGKATADAISFLITPWMAPVQGAKLGGQIALANANAFIGPIIRGGSRTPLATRAVAKVEDIISTMGTLARENPFKTVLVEGGAAAASVKGTEMAETVAPDNPWIRFGFETVGGLSGAVAADLSVNRVPQVIKWGGRGVYNLFNKLRGKAPLDDMQLRYGISEGELKTAGNFITEQLEKNGENPKAILEILNDPSFSKWLVDKDGNKIDLDPATRAASVTLLSLQNQFIDAAPGTFGEDAGSKMKSSIDALRRALLAMYADGSKQALSDAALVQTSLFAAVLDSKVARAVSNAQEAMRRVRPEGDNVDLEAAENIFTLLDGQYKAGRDEEQLLWRQIPKNVEVTSFINEDGVTQSTPNFVSTWNTLLADETVEIRRMILKNDDLNFLQKFVERKTDELGLSPVDGGPAPVAPTALLEQKRLKGALDQIAGTPDADVPGNIVETMQEGGASSLEIITELRNKAKAAREAGKNPPLAYALDSQATLLSAQKRQAEEFKEEAAKIPEIVGVNAYELVRTRGRALAMGRRLNAAGLNEEARIAHQMADAMLSDLNSMGIGVSQAYDTARSFSRAFNDVFTRKYAGDVLGTKKNGAPKISIETMANNMMKGDAAFMRTANLDGIANFQVTQALTNLLRSDNPDLPDIGAVGATLLEDLKKDIDPQSKTLDMDKMREWYGRNEAEIKSVPNLNTRITAAMNGSVQLRSAEDTLLRTIRANSLNPDGTLNVGALSNWRNQQTNERLLDLFPSLKKDLDNVEKASALLTQTRIDAKTADTQERLAVGLYELLPNKTTNAATGVALAMSEDNAKGFSDMNRLMRLIDDVGDGGFTVTAKDSPNTGKTWTKEELKVAMRTAIYDNIFFSAADGVSFNPAVAYNRLFGKHANADISMADWMKSNDLLSAKAFATGGRNPDEVLDETKKFLRQMAQIQAFTMRAKPGQTDEFFRDIGEGVKIIASIGGSVGGTHLRQLFGGGGAGNLTASGRGASYGQALASKYMAELPQSLQSSRIAIILQNETLLKQVLKTGRTQREKNALAKQLEHMFVTNYIVSPFRRGGGEALQTVTDETSYDDIDGTVIPPADVPQDLLTGLGLQPFSPKIVN